MPEAAANAAGSWERVEGEALGRMVTVVTAEQPHASAAIITVSSRIPKNRFNTPPGHHL
jgi:hypothetical protein